MRRLSVLLALLMTASLVVVSSPAEAAVRKWPKGRITYVDLTQDSRAVKLAVKAWNSSGLDIRFVEVRRARRAQLKIRNSTNVPSGCGSGLASMGYVPRGRAFVNILHGTDADGQGCAWPGQATVLAHELGHVLGLPHYDKGCSVMNSYHVNGVAGHACLGDDIEAGKPGRWRCRLLETVDLKRVKRMYGGSIKPSGPDWCDAIDRIPATGPVTTAVDQYGRLSLALTRAAEPAVPAWLGTWGFGAPGFEVHATPGACTAVAGDEATEVQSQVWDVPVGGTQTEYLFHELAAGTYCLSVWQFDQGTNYALAPATTMVTVP